MLVRNGHGIILKTIAGRIPASVTHMSFGSSYGSGITVPNNFMRENMGFEVLRVPVQVSFDHLTSQTGQVITGREDFQLVYKGEIPVNRRIAFDEIGLWCGSANIRYGDAGGVLVSSVDSSEHWIKKQYDPVTNEQLEQSLVLEEQFFQAIQASYYDLPGIKPAQPRIGNTALPIIGWNDIPPETIDTYELATNIDLSQYSPLDTIKFALTWAPSSVDLDLYPDNYEITWVMNFTFNFTSKEAQFATKTIPLDYVLEWNPAAGFMNTYKILETELGDLTDASRGILKSIGITVLNASSVGVKTPPPKTLILVDGIRIDRSINNNPLYGLVFYDYVAKPVAIDTLNYEVPIEKMSGFDGHIEHRVRMFANATGEQTV